MKKKTKFMNKIKLVIIVRRKKKNKKMIKMKSNLAKFNPRIAENPRCPCFEQKFNNNNNNDSKNS